MIDMVVVEPFSVLDSFVKTEAQTLGDG